MVSNFYERTYGVRDFNPRAKNMKASEVVLRLQDHLTTGVLDPDMPMFVLWATDKTAPETVRYWAHGARLSGSPDEKVDNALLIAKAMEEWPVKRVPGAPLDHVENQ